MYVCFLQLEENLVQHINSLTQDSESDFWRKARFLVHTSRQLASHKDGEYKIGFIIEYGIIQSG